MTPLKEVMGNPRRFSCSKYYSTITVILILYVEAVQVVTSFAVLLDTWRRKAEPLTTQLQ